MRPAVVHCVAHPAHKSAMTNLIRTLTALLLSCSCLSTAQSQVLREGDRVVLLGGTLIEREQVEGYWETQLIASLPYQVTFRNLGWSGDTVWCESRGMFDPPAEGYKRMLAQVGEINPTVIILGYGNSEAFDGPVRVPAFKEQYLKLLADLQAPERRFILLTPVPMEVTSVPGSDRDAAQKQAQRYNENVAVVTQAITEIASATEATVVDLAAAFSDNASAFTDNGVTLNGRGYYLTGKLLTAQLGGATTSPQLQLPEPAITSVTELDLPGDVHALRGLIRRKNELVFHRWRPQNFTYLFGFRKHEQGNNAVEIPQFDPLVVELENNIEALKSTVTK